MVPVSPRQCYPPWLPAEKLLDPLDAAIRQVHVATGCLHVASPDIVECFLHQKIHPILHLQHVGAQAHTTHLVLEALQTALGCVGANRELIILLASLTQAGFRLRCFMRPLSYL